MGNRKVQEARVVQYEFSISIDASRRRVWRALTDQLSSWWLPDFRMLGPDSVVSLEPHAGGRLYEQDGDQELLWYNVLAFMPEELLSLVGYCTPEFGGPLTTMLSARISGTNSSTVLSITDALYGRVTDGQADSLRSGWTQLFSSGLKEFVEH